MKKAFLQFLVLSLFFLLVGCAVNDKGACEYYSSSGSYTSATCRDCEMEGTQLISEPDASSLCPSSSSSGVLKTYWHQDNSCSDIGYSIPDPNGYGSNTYNADEDPSPYGHFGSGAGGSGGGGGGGIDCNSVWTGNPADIQVSTMCQTACVYSNAGSTEGVNATCSLVAGMGGTSSCTVCN